MSKKDPFWIIFFVILVIMFVVVEPFLPGKSNKYFWKTIGIIIIVVGIITMIVIR